MSDDIIRRNDAIKVLEHLSACKEYGVEIGTEEETFIGKYEAITLISDLPTIEPTEEFEWCYDRGYVDAVQGIADEMIRQDLHIAPNEQKRGEWLWSPRDADGTVSGCCSNCSFSHLFVGGHTAQYNFCPNCGADMRKGADDE